jgi:acyl-CoA synthetase (AMP-forming)/AMP-acid ligase II
VQYATAEIGVILVNVNPAYRSHDLAYVLRQSGCRTLISAPSFKTSDYVAIVDEVRGDGAELDHAIFLWTPEWDALFDETNAAPMSELDERRAGLAADDDAALTRSLLDVAHDRARYGEVWELAERLLDHDANAAMWRSRHVLMVERQIGTKSGTGGSTGAPYLRSRLDLHYYPLLWDLRSHL